MVKKKSIDVQVPFPASTRTHDDSEALILETVARQGLLVTLTATHSSHPGPIHWNFKPQSNLLARW
jgi:hypothetical protein